MATFTVRFIQQHAYIVEAKDVDEAMDIAEEDFISDMRSPIANTSWEEMIVEDEDGEEIAYGRPN
jgi:hypothetical protein